jgi:host factor-I protein
MDSESRNLQNDFFNAARKEKSHVTVFLSNGKKLVGRIRSFDKFTLLLDSPYGQQIIFKHAISTISASSRNHAENGRREGGDAPDSPPRDDS